MKSILSIAEPLSILLAIPQFLALLICRGRPGHVLSDAITLDVVLRATLKYLVVPFGIVTGVICVITNFSLHAAALAYCLLAMSLMAYQLANDR